MKFRKPLSILVALCLLVCLAVPAFADNSDQQMVAGINFGLDSFDPQYSWNMFCTRQVYDTLLAIGPDGEIGPNLATDWSVSDDGLVYTFTLREDARFSNGEPVTVDDCVFSFERAMVSSYVDAGFTSSAIKSVEAADEHTFVINLLAPNPTLLAALTNEASGAPYGGIVSQAVAEQYGDQFGLSAESIVGSGPYKVTEWVPDEYAVFEANEYYWGETPDIQSFKLVLMQDTSSALIALENNEMQLYLSDLATTDIPIAEANENLNVVTYPASRFYYIVLNTADGVCSNPALRQAIQLAVDREKLNLLVTDGYGEIIDQLGGWSFTACPDPSTSTWPEMDVDAAKKIIEDNGLTGTTVTIKCQNSGAYADMMTSLRQDLEAIGLVVETTSQERATWTEEVCQNKDFDITMIQWACDPDLDVNYTLLYTDTACNYGGYSNEKVDELLMASRSTADTDARTKAFEEIDQLIAEDVPVIPLFTAVAVRGYTTSITCPDTYIIYDNICHYSWQ